MEESSLCGASPLRLEELRESSKSLRPVQEEAEETEGVGGRWNWLPPVTVAGTVTTSWGLQDCFEASSAGSVSRKALSTSSAEALRSASMAFCAVDSADLRTLRQFAGSKTVLSLSS